jgi:hypothetical protein
MWWNSTAMSGTPTHFFQAKDAQAEDVFSPPLRFVV